MQIYIYIRVFIYMRMHPPANERGGDMRWLRSVGSITLGRAAARRTAPKLPRAIRVGPNLWSEFRE